jgi:hypothetical protein
MKPREMSYHRVVEAAYRDPGDGLRQERESLLEARRRETSKLVPQARVIYPRRLGRTAFGAVGLCGAVVLGVGAALGRSGLTTVLLFTWLAAVVAYFVGRLLGHARLNRALAALLAQSTDSARDVDKLERTTPLMQARRLADPIEGRSMVLPIAALGVLFPLTMCYALALVTVPAAHRLPQFDWWISLSFAAVWPGFLVTALIAMRHARRARSRTVSELMNTFEHAGWTAYGWTVLAVGLWGVVRGGYILAASNNTPKAIGLATLPVMGVALAWLCFLPWLFSVLHRRISHERMRLGVELGGFRQWP